MTGTIAVLVRIPHHGGRVRWEPPDYIHIGQLKGVVAPSVRENRIYAYEVRPDGSTGQRSVFASVTGADGVTVDCAGNVHRVSNTRGARLLSSS